MYSLFMMGSDMILNTMRDCLMSTVSLWRHSNTETKIRNNIQITRNNPALAIYIEGKSFIRCHKMLGMSSSLF